MNEMMSAPLHPLVLVATPEDSLGHALARSLEEMGLPVQVTTSFQSTLEALSPGRFHVVLLDSLLAGPPGLDVLGEVRRRLPAGDPSLMVLANPAEGIGLAEALERGADDGMTLPVSGPVAAARLKVHLRMIEAVRRLRHTEERFSLLLTGSNEGLWDWDLRTQKVYYSPFWKQLLGLQEHEVGDAPTEWMDRIHPEDRERVEEELRQHLAGRSASFASQHRLQHADGGYRWMVLRGVARREEGADEPVRIAGTLADVTASRLYDALTGLPNRTLMLDRIERAIARARRKSELIFALLVVSLDRFEVLQTQISEREIRTILATAGKRLQQLMRTADTVARLEGPNFAIHLDEIRHVSDARRVAGRVAEALGAPIELAGREFRLSTSIGIALSVTGYERPEDIVRDAFVAMNQARSGGGNRQEMFDQKMQSEVELRMRLEADLRRALERDEFQVFYQPIVSLETWRISGFEALVRWRHPERGLVSPAEFIPVAEETGQIVPIGEWVLRESSRQMKCWQDEHPELDLSISVNLSGRQVAEPDLVDTVARVIDETGLRPGSLKLELTETLLMHHYEGAIQKMHHLRDMGIKLSIDDFGTGYSSLSHLHRFPIDFLKVDRSFVGRVGQDARESEIVKVIVGLGRNLGMQVIAEGVETSEQAGFLRDLECEYGQGYYFARPLDAEAAGALLPHAVRPVESEEGIFLVPRVVEPPVASS
jgi:diguanylate cyclase (GGDEF)-like protein/PAS domain S-box-containing protein